MTTILWLDLIGTILVQRAFDSERPMGPRMPRTRVDLLRPGLLLRFLPMFSGSTWSSVGEIVLDH